MEENKQIQATPNPAEGRKNSNSECKDCLCTINKNSFKCQNCGSYQKGYKRIFSNFSTLGAFILTWVSIFAAPPLWSYLEDKKAVIKIAPLECDINEYCFMVSNTGNRSAVLSDIYGYNKATPNTMGIIPNNHKNKTIKPSEVLIVKAKISGTVPPMLPYELQKSFDGRDIPKNCMAEFKFIQHYAVEESEKIEFVCLNESFMNNT